MFTIFPLSVNAESWLSGWNYRITFTLDSSDIDESLVDFPILLNFSISSGINGTDVTHIFDTIGDAYNRTAYTDSEDNRLYFEKDYWNATEERGLIWLKTPAISNITNSTVYCYYDALEDGYAYNNPEAVWGAKFVMVHHLNDETTSIVLDSTSNDNDGAKKGADEPIEVNGKIWKAQDFFGDDDFINVGNSADLNSYQMTVSFWVTPDDVESSNMVYARDESGKRAYYISIGETTDQLKFACWVGGAFKTVNVAVSAEQTYFITCRFNGTRLSVFLNGGTETNGLNAVGTIDTTDGDTTIGKRVYATYEGYFEGWIDELEHSNTSRSNAWIGASYETQRDHLNFPSSPSEYGYSIQDVIALTSLSFVLILVAIALIVIIKKK